MSNHIGTLNEKPLHAALKQWYTRPGDQLEVLVDGFVIDILRGDLLVEIQTANFSAIRNKLRQLILQHQLRLVYPVASEKWIHKISPDENKTIKPRKSPKRGTYADIFTQLVYLPELMRADNLAIEVVLIKEQELRRHEPGRAWRRKGWVTEERRLLEVLDRKRYNHPDDFIEFLPKNLPDPFTTTDMANLSTTHRRICTRMAYCLRKMGVIQEVGKHGRSILYSQNL